MYPCITMHVSTEADLRDYNYNDPAIQTYEFDCKNGKGDIIEISDTSTGTVGHGISEVKIFGEFFFSKFKLMLKVAY